MPPRSKTPLYFGEGLDRETGLMVVQPVSFEDLRNVLLHEGKAILRPGFLPAGVGAFDEVDTLLAGEALKSDGLGIVVGYDSATERVYVYRVTPDLALVELLGEWVHDLSSGWGSAVPRIIMAEVFGRVFMAHDESRVTRRAPTLYYDPITGTELLNNLTATFAGTSEESAESGAPESESVVVVADAIRFRGVARHLAYLVGWGFGTATEIRPELVRISLPGDPITFDPNHYFSAGDRRDPVLAGASAGAPDGPAGIFHVWKRSETHAIIGYDRATFGIRLIDPRHGIVASRAHVNLEGANIAWSEEGPRIFDGLSPSESLEIPLGLEEWEPDDLVDEGDIAYAFAHYVPRERVAWFHFGRRVYALTARIKGRWRWSYQTLGFDAYGAVTLFETTEEKVPPEGYPSCDSIEPAGTFANITVGNHQQDGDETIEVWIREVSAASGDVESLPGGGTRGITDFSEFPLVAPSGVIPAGVTRFQAVGAAGSLPTTYAVVDDADPDVGRYLTYDGHADGASMLYWHTIDSFADSIVGAGAEVLALIWVGAQLPDHNNRQMIGCGFFRQSGSLRWGIDITKASSFLPANDDQLTGHGGTGAIGLGSGTDLNDIGYNTWKWLRVRIQPSGGTNTRWRGKIWTLGDPEPAGWDRDVTLTTPDISAGPFTPGIFVGNAQGQWGRAQRVALLAFSTDPDANPPLEEAPPAFGPWTLARSVAVTTGSSQVVQITGLTPGTTYEVALRYRRGLFYNAGAEDTDNPDTWPSVSRCEFSTTVDPPTLDSAVWSRTSAGSEKIQLTITPVVGQEADDIEIWVASALAGPYTLLDTVAGPHAGQFTYDDVDPTGEVARYYKVLTAAAAGDSPFSDPVRVWVGPAAVPQFAYKAFGVGNNPIYGFTTTDPTLETEYIDTLIPGEPPSNGPFVLKNTMAAGVTEGTPSSTYGLDEDDVISFFAYVRHKKTTFGVEDFGEQSLIVQFNWPADL